MIFYYHIRRRLLPKGGRPGYLGTNPRYNGTYCSSDPTSFDIAVHDRALPWKREKDGQMFNPCAACVDARIAEGGTI